MHVVFGRPRIYGETRCFVPSAEPLSSVSKNGSDRLEMLDIGGISVYYTGRR